MKCIPPQPPLLCGKTGVCRGIPIFLIFAPKYRLWVLVRSRAASATFSTENFQFFQLKKNLHITLACFHNEQHLLSSAFDKKPSLNFNSSILCWCTGDIDIGSLVGLVRS